MEKYSAQIKVTSPSFSRNDVLKRELLASFPNSTFNMSGKELEGKELIDFLSETEGAIISLNRVDETVLAYCPKLRIISKYGVGLDNIDQEACAKKGIVLGWTGGLNKRSVSEQTLAFMISLCRNIYQSSYKLKNGTWDKSGGTQLSGKTIGIIGVGHVGKDLVTLLEPFHCTILANDIINQQDYYQKHNIREETKEEIYRTADIITLHVPLTPETKYMINENTLRMMKNTAFLINTSRGKVVNQEALKQALKNGIIAGAALDVYESEPPHDKEFLSLPNIICTPHIGGSSLESVTAMGRSAIAHLNNYFGQI